MEAGTSSEPEADPLGPILDAQPDDGAGAGPGAPSSSGPDPARPSPAYCEVVSMLFAWVEGAMIRSRGESWRAAPEVREGIVRANAHALELYAPDFDHPLYVAVGSVLVWAIASHQGEKPASPENETAAEGRGDVEGPGPSIGSAFTSA